LQNKILLERSSQQKNSNTKSTNNSINSDINAHNNRNGYFVMPDFNNSLTEFSGREASEEVPIMDKFG